jgi:hypothetical protein
MLGELEPGWRPLLMTSLTPEEFPSSDEQRTEFRRLDRLAREGPVGVSWESVRAEMTPRS